MGFPLGKETVNDNPSKSEFHLSCNCAQHTRQKHGKNKCPTQEQKSSRHEYKTYAIQNNIGKSLGCDIFLSKETSVRVTDAEYSEDGSAKTSTTSGASFSNVRRSSPGCDEVNPWIGCHRDAV